jgi:NADH:ubiquinone oxidoreductase subunit 6 (subunit J)
MQAWPAGIAVSILAGLLAGVFYSNWKDAQLPVSTVDATTQLLGEMLMTSYLLPFEIASVVLLVALIGAALIARRNR